MNEEQVMQATDLSALSMQVIVIAIIIGIISNVVGILIAQRLS